MTESIYSIDDINAATIIADDINAASIMGEISGTGVVADAFIGGVEIIDYPDVPPATTSTIGGIIVGEDLLVTEEGVLSVDKANSVEGDNTRPITAAAVYTEIGNINALLATI